MSHHKNTKKLQPTSDHKDTKKLQPSSSDHKVTKLDPKLRSDSKDKCCRKPKNVSFPPTVIYLFKKSPIPSSTPEPPPTTGQEIIPVLSPTVPIPTRVEFPVTELQVPGGSTEASRYVVLVNGTYSISSILEYVGEVTFAGGAETAGSLLLTVNLILRVNGVDEQTVSHTVNYIPQVQIGDPPIIFNPMVLFDQLIINSLLKLQVGDIVEVFISATYTTQNPGNTVRVFVNDQSLFYGYLTSVDKKGDPTRSCQCSTSPTLEPTSSSSASASSSKDHKDHKDKDSKDKHDKCRCDDKCKCHGKCKDGCKCDDSKSKCKCKDECKCRGECKNGCKCGDQNVN